jgi:BrnA antitoxin of type II toxin-antitoxin system
MNDRFRTGNSIGWTSVSLRIDVDVREWFKSRGSGYQTRINAVLQAFKEATLQDFPSRMRNCASFQPATTEG